MLAEPSGQNGFGIFVIGSLYSDYLATTSYILKLLNHPFGKLR